MTGGFYVGRPLAVSIHPVIAAKLTTFDDGRSQHHVRHMAVGSKPIFIYFYLVVAAVLTDFQVTGGCM